VKTNNLGLLPLDEEEQTQININPHVKFSINNSLSGTDSIVTPKQNSDMRDCPFCAEKIKSAAKICRYCKHEIIGTTEKHKTFQLTSNKKSDSQANNLQAFFVIILALFGGGGLLIPVLGGKNSSLGVVVPTNAVANIITPQIIDQSKYGNVHEGMSYSEVVSIVGNSGSETSSNHTEGIKGVMESIDTKSYSWQNSDGSNMMVIFQNDKLISKAQFGL
jgi:hypothetical protein